MSYTSYGDRGRAERTPGSHDFVIVAGLLVAAAVAAGTLVAAGLLDGLVLSGRAPSLAHRRLASVVVGGGDPPRAAPGGVHGGPARRCLAVLVDGGGPGRPGRHGGLAGVDVGVAAGGPKPMTVSPPTPPCGGRCPPARPGPSGPRPARTWPDGAAPADTEFGYRLGRAVTAGHRQLWASWESSMLVIGPPGCGKTFRLLVPALLDHPGPAIVTSTKVDIYEATAKARQARGRPVWVLDPEDMAPAGGQVRWSVVRGCEDTRTAERRAAALVAGAPGGQTVDTGNSAFFKTSALSVLKAFLHAAALGDKTIVDVTRWCRGDHAEAQAILAGQADVMVDPARMLTQHTIGAPETTSGVMRYVENTLACFAHRPVIDLCTPSPDDDFDMHRFVSEGGTVYLLGRGEKVSSASALTTAFCEELLYVAGDVIAPTRPGRRLTPPLLACLDEAPSVAPIPTLPLQLADARGRGIVVILSLRARRSCARNGPTTRPTPCSTRRISRPCSGGCRWTGTCAGCPSWPGSAS